MNWRLVSGSFIADSAYQYLMIGNFFTDANTDTVRVLDLNSDYILAAYYYIDDVCVSTDSLTCNSITGIDFLSNSKFEIYSCFNENNIYIKPNDSKEYQYKIYTTMGLLIKSDIMIGQSIINMSPFESHVYFIIIYRNNIPIKKTMFINPY